MGLLAGLVGALARPDDRALLRVEAERLAQLLDLAAAESRLTGKTASPVRADAAKYSFWRWRDDAGWSEVRDDSLRARSLPPGMAISALRIEAMAEGRPESSARSLAYEVQMSLGEARYVVAGSPLGAVAIHARRSRFEASRWSRCWSRSPSSRSR